MVELDDVVATADIFITTTGNFGIISAEQMGRMKHNAIVANVGHFDNEIDMAGLAKRARHHARRRSSRRCTSGRSRTATRSSCCPKGRLMNLGNATGHPRFVMSNSFTNQAIAQIELFTKPGEYATDVYRLPKHLDEKVARLHLDALGVQLTKLTKAQAEYIGVDVEGPYKLDHYRY